MNAILTCYVSVCVNKGIYACVWVHVYEWVCIPTSACDYTVNLLLISTSPVKRPFPDLGTGVNHLHQVLCALYQLGTHPYLHKYKQSLATFQPTTERNCKATNRKCQLRLLLQIHTLSSCTCICFNLKLTQSILSLHLRQMHLKL